MSRLWVIRYKLKGVFMKNNPKDMRENIINFLQETIKNIQGCRLANKNKSEINDNINKLESKIREFNEHVEKLLRPLNIDLKSSSNQDLKSLKLKSSHKQFIDRLKDIQQDACLTKTALLLAEAKNKKNRKNKSRFKNSTNKQQMKERRKLFKPIGGDKKWLPM